MDIYQTPVPPHSFRTKQPLWHTNSLPLFVASSKSDQKEAPKFFCLFLQLINRWNLIQFYNHLFRFLFIIIYRSLRLISAQWLLIMSPDKLLENPWIIAERKDFWRERKIATEVILYDFDSDAWHQMNFHLLLRFEWIVAVSFNKLCITNICRFVNYS